MNAGAKAIALLCFPPITFGALGQARGADHQAPTPRARAEVQAVLAKAPKAAARQQLPMLHIVLLADVKDHGPQAHDYPLWQKRWTLLLGGRSAAGDSVTQVNLFGPPPKGVSDELAAGAANVKVTTAWQWPSKQQLDTADLIVMQCYRSGGSKRTWSAQRIEELETYLARGGGFAVIHPATYTLRDLSQPGGQRIAGLTGLAYDRSILVRHGPIKLAVTATEHPICLGLPKTIDFVDEPYWPPVGDIGQVTVLAVSQERYPKGSESLQPQPMFWTARKGKGRIFACVLGHFTWTFDDPYFRILVLRGMAWAAGQDPYRFDNLVTRGIPLR